MELARLLKSFSTAGIHPTHSTELDTLKSIRELIINDRAKEKRILAIGECGLDYDRLHFASKEIQIENFINHFKLTEEFQLPMFLHLRNADADFLEIIKQNRSRFTTGVVHSFDSNLETLRQLINLDLYIGINGCSMKTAENLSVIKEIPIDKLVIETDAPWCEIRPSHASYPLIEFSKSDLLDNLKSFKQYKKEKFVLGEMVKSRNEPCKLLEIISVLANLKEMDPNELADIIYDNTCRLFGSNFSEICLSPMNSNP